MTETLKDLLTRIKADAENALAQLSAPTPPPPDPTGTPIRTAGDLMLACSTGGNYSLMDGTYVGNFTIRKPLTLSGSHGAVIFPLDIYVPPLTVMAPDVSLIGFKVLNGAPDREVVVVGDVAATDLLVQPRRVVLSKLLIEAGLKGGHRGIALHGAYIVVDQCRVTGFWEAGRDSQAIWINNGPGPYTITNNWLEASGENILVGGDRIMIQNMVPSDITIRGNTFYKPAAWKTNGASVKNSVELKAGQRVMITDNLIDGCWRGAQSGIPVLFTVRNQYGDNPWVIVDEVTFARNKVINCPDAAGVSILGRDDNYPSRQTAKVTIEGNLFRDSPIGIQVGNGVRDILIVRNNTFPAITNAIMKFYDTAGLPPASGAVRTPLTFERNVTKAGAYAFTGDGTAVGQQTLETYATTGLFNSNVIERSVERPGLIFPGANRLVDPGKLAALLDAELHMIDKSAGW